jgi:hypothetical protein
MSKKAESEMSITVPSYLQGANAQSAESMVSKTDSTPRISLKGQVFRFKCGGEEVKKDKGPLEVVILGVEPMNGLSKTFYVNGYQPDSSDPPDCSSWDGIKPDAWCDSPQADYCSNCEQSKWGSAKSMSGGKAKACKESKRLIVVEASDIEEQYYVLTVTISSLKALSTYGKWLAANNLPFAAIVTELDFEDSDFPQLTFKFKRFLEEKDGLKAIEISNNREWYEGNTQEAIQAPSKSQSLPEPAGKASSKKKATPAKSTDELLDTWEDS